MRKCTMKVLILSNCQGNSYKTAIEALNPLIQCDFVITTHIPEIKPTVYSDYDIVFCQHQCLGYIPENIRASLNIQLVPNIIFSGFHPDMTYLSGIPKNSTNNQPETIENLMVSYHSAICIISYKYELTVEQCLAYYNSYAFNKFNFYENYDIAKEILFNECHQVNFPIEKYFYKWEQQAPFMYSMNHPKLFIFFDIVKEIFGRLGITISNTSWDKKYEDILGVMPIWPVYPLLARYLKIEDAGSFGFKMGEPSGVIDLKYFVEDCYQRYSNYIPESITMINVDADEISTNINTNTRTTVNPYRNLPASAFWKKSISRIAYDKIDPVTKVKFKIEPEDLVATAGSCFAQHISKTIAKEGYNYYVAEKLEDLTPEENLSRNFGVFSARFGNLYTVRQLLQLFKRAYNIEQYQLPIWKTSTGTYIDPYRPQVEPQGFPTGEEAYADRASHLEKTREMFQNLNVFVFTLGLTEAWRYKLDGSIIPNHPGTVNCPNEIEDQYEFVNFDVNEVMSDLFEFLNLLTYHNSTCKIILTVSPVPLIATYSHNHVLPATVYSKSVLRVVAQMATDTYKQVDYFPSYEIITNSKSTNHYFEEDYREVKPEGVAHVMTVFKRHYLLNESVKDIEEDPKETEHKKKQSAMMSKLYDIVCDEEILDSED